MPGHEQLAFPERVIRGIAILGMALAVVGMLQGGEEAWRNLSAGLGSNDWRLAMLQLLGFADKCFLAIASYGLYRHKRWARVCMLTWAALAILISLTISIYIWVNYYIPTRQDPGRPSALYFIMMSIGPVVQASTFPVVVILVLIQREVANILTHRQPGGFEVLPVESIDATAR